MEIEEVKQGGETGLESLRAEVDECDRQLIQVLGRRFELVRRIGAYKAAENLPVEDGARERELLADRKRQAAANGDYPVEAIFKVILSESRRFQLRGRKRRKSGE